MTDGCKQFRVADTDEWMAVHGRHGEISKRPNEHQPPKGAYQMFTLFCPCGAKHVVTETSNEVPKVR
jgi:hypothetical protein